jgi:hypothetical protein
MSCISYRSSLFWLNINDFRSTQIDVVGYGISSGLANFQEGFYELSLRALPAFSDLQCCKDLPMTRIRRLLAKGVDHGHVYKPGSHEIVITKYCVLGQRCCNNLALVAV